MLLIIGSVTVAGFTSQAELGEQTHRDQQIQAVAAKPDDLI